jgi:hypothetical protein
MMFAAISVTDGKCCDGPLELRACRSLPLSVRNGREGTGRDEHEKVRRVIEKPRARGKVTKTAIARAVKMSREHRTLAG